MIAIAIVYGLIGYMEWRSLQRNNRKQGTKWKVALLSFVLMLGIEVLYLYRERFSFGIFVASLMEPLGRWIFFDK